MRKTPQTDLQTYTRQHINSAYKSWGGKTKRTQENCKKTGNHYINTTLNARQRKERKQSTKTTKQYADSIKVTKKISENNNTVFHSKNVTDAKKT